MGHEDFAPNAAGKILAEPRDRSLHPRRVRRNIVADFAVPAGHGLDEGAAVVLHLEAGAVQLVLDYVFRKPDLGAPGDEGIGVRGLLLAAHRHEVAGFGPAVGRILADFGEDRVVGIELDQLVPKGVELGVGYLGLAVVIEVLMLFDEVDELDYPRVRFSRHCLNIVRRGPRRCQTGRVG